MKNFTAKTACRVAVAALLSLGITAGAVGVASATTVGHARGHHHGLGIDSANWGPTGVVTAYTAGSSLSILSKGATISTVYTLTSATTITGLVAGATLAAPDKVRLVLSSTTPVTVTSIKVEAPHTQCVTGVVTAYTAGSSLSILSKGATISTVYTLTSATTITGLVAGATLAAPDKVRLVLSSTTPVTVTSIFVVGTTTGKNCSHGHHGAQGSGAGRNGAHRHASHGRHSSRHFHGRH